MIYDMNDTARAAKARVRGPTVLERLAAEQEAQVAPRKRPAADVTSVTSESKKRRATEPANEQPSNEVVTASSTPPAQPREPKRFQAVPVVTLGRTRG